MKKLVTSKVVGLWLMDLLKSELFDRYFLLIPQGITIFRASFNDYFCYFQVSFILQLHNSSCEYTGTAFLHIFRLI